MKEQGSYWAWVFAKKGGAKLSEELSFELSAVEWRYEGQSWEEECVKALRVKRKHHMWMSEKILGSFIARIKKEENKEVEVTGKKLNRNGDIGHCKEL